MKKTGICILGLLLAIGLVFAPPIAAQDEGILLETIGVLSAQGLYLTYTAIGTLADGYNKDLYEEEFMLQILQQYIELTKVAKDQMQSLLSTQTLTGEDIGFVNNIVTTYNLLLAEANAMRNYVLTGTQEHVDEFHKHRNAAWANISDLLGLQE